MLAVSFLQRFIRYMNFLGTQNLATGRISRFSSLKGFERLNAISSMTYCIQAEPTPRIGC